VVDFEISVASSHGLDLVVHLYPAFLAVDEYFGLPRHAPLVSNHGILIARRPHVGFLGLVAIGSVANRERRVPTGVRVDRGNLGVSAFLGLVLLVLVVGHFAEDDDDGAAAGAAAAAHLERGAATLRVGRRCDRLQLLSTSDWLRDFVVVRYRLVTIPKCPRIEVAELEAGEYEVCCSVSLLLTSIGAVYMYLSLAADIHTILVGFLRLDSC